MQFPTMWYVPPAKTQIGLRIHVVCSLLVTWIFYECWATDWTSFGDSKLKRSLHRLVWVYTCENATLLEITCRGSSLLRASANFKHYNVMFVISGRENNSYSGKVFFARIFPLHGFPLPPTVDGAKFWCSLSRRIVRNSWGNLWSLAPSSRDR